jgi:tetratricopeptide (TPR) repeat protein
MIRPSPPAAQSTQLRLLGDPAVVYGDGSIKGLERRAAGLLALVALEPGVTRARAAAMLWPESDNARQALRQQIARFRKNYGAALIEGDDALFIASGVAVDALRIDGGALLGELSFDDCEDFATWLARARAQRRSGETARIEQQLAAAEAAGELTEATRLAEQLLQTNHDSEAHHRTLMRLHYLRGDSAQAQRVYERLVRHLKARFGAQPAAETEALARALRTAQTAPQAGVPSTRPVPVTVLRPPRMIGRQRELAALRDAWAVGHAALLVGEPGLGKSRLLAEFSAGRRVLNVTGRPGDAGVPYATLSRLLRAIFERGAIELPAARRCELARLLPELAPALPLPADGQRLLLRGAVEAVLAQAHAGGAGADGVMVDDLHFADDASVEMLQALICGGAGSGEPDGLRWALAQRPGEGGVAAARLRAELEEAQALAAVTLAPLTAAEMAELIDSLDLPELDSAQLAPQLARHTGGNPLYALETLKQGLASGLLRQGRLPTPVNVGALIERRLKQLSERALALARVAAIAGVDFGIPLAEEVMGVRALDLADGWRELEAAQVLRENAFAHDLVYDAVLRSIPVPIARHLHGAVARFLESHDGVAARIAGHFLAAGLERPALPALHRAAGLARAGLRRREELGFLMTAARIEEAAGNAAAAWETLQAAIDAQMCVDTVTLPELEAARDRLAQSPLQQSELAQQRADFFTNTGRYAEAEALARRAVETARASGSLPRLAEALSTLSCALAMQDRPEEALAPSDEMLALLGQIDEPEAKLYSERGVLFDNLGRTREALPLHRTAVELTLRRGQTSLAVSALSNLACSQMDAGHVRAAVTTMEQALQLAGAHDDGTGTLASLLPTHGNALRELGRHDQALHAIDAARTVLASGAAAYLPLADLAQAAVWWHLGQVGRVQQALPDDAALAALPRWMGARRWLLVARCRSALRQPIGDALERAAEMVTDGGIRPVRDIVALHVAVANGRLADLDVLQLIGAEARRDGREGVVLSAACYGARLAATLGMPHLALVQADEARALLEQGAGQEAVAPADIGELEAWLCLVQAYGATGRAAEARHAWERGVARLDQIERDHVPAEFRESFRRRNPVHWALQNALPRAAAADR